MKIDSDVARYAINSDGSQIVYLKGRDGILYLHDLTDTNKIASGVGFFTVPDDFKKSVISRMKTAGILCV